MNSILFFIDVIKFESWFIVSLTKGIERYKFLERRVLFPRGRSEIASMFRFSNRRNLNPVRVISKDNEAAGVNPYVRAISFPLLINLVSARVALSIISQARYRADTIDQCQTRQSRDRARPVSGHNSDCQVRHMPTWKRS